MLVERTQHGMGMQSWRYSMYVEDGLIRRMFICKIWYSISQTMSDELGSRQY